jgi:hypothetical protein
MEEVEVPRVSARVTVSEAIARMKDANRVVVSVDLREGPKLLFLSELANVPGETPIEKIVGGTEAVGVPIPGGTVNFATSHAVRRGIGVTLRGAGKRFAMVGFNGDKARVVGEPDELSQLQQRFFA